jgi:hypothetical protein
MTNTNSPPRTSLACLAAVAWMEWFMVLPS